MVFLTTYVYEIQARHQVNIKLQTYGQAYMHIHTEAWRNTNTCQMQTNTCQMQTNTQTHPNKGTNTETYTYIHSCQQINNSQNAKWRLGVMIVKLASTIIYWQTS